MFYFSTSLLRTNVSLYPSSDAGITAVADDEEYGEDMSLETSHGFV